ncbi:uncharacterized protein HMPREF1120_01703 [Exophiala dermatitidis NIH/UT8656]|uniref:Uncharacterized protein n=1 Tax=Exophiala dermatitidis (strain ATCC 34100 / CBS 525.76 / NIH/UT8656) TaxID=858893 RepID=H6BTB6_EXODN|nr:uncharacterized protein HMPREF1120_01703 [Exophiala dermatitidis NIH/UT8656]EHY53512.1 hypothetical protein HMPREF1120_01703 [Exophiala dermatitidis NIH/UT8656]
MPTWASGPHSGASRQSDLPGLKMGQPCSIIGTCCARYPWSCWTQISSLLTRKTNPRDSEVERAGDWPKRERAHPPNSLRGPRRRHLRRQAPNNNAQGQSIDK